MPEMVTVVSSGVMVVAVFIVCGFAWLHVDAQERVPILRCFHHGEVVVSVPIPAPPDFRVQMSAGSVTSAEWTLANGQRQVLASTAPCVYLVTSPVPGSTGAGNE